MRSWREWVPPWERNKKRQKKYKKTSSANQQVAGPKENQPARDAAERSKSPTSTIRRKLELQRENYRDVTSPNRTTKVVIVGACGEPGTVMFPPVQRAPTATPAPPLRLETRQAGFLSREDASYVQQRAAKLPSTSTLHHEREYVVLEGRNATLLPKPLAEDKGVYRRGESLSQNHTTRFFTSSRTIATPIPVAKSGVFQPKPAMGLRQGNPYPREGEFNQKAYCSRMNQLVDKALPLPENEDERVTFDGKLEHFKIMQAERQVMRDRAKSDYFVLYAQGKTTIQLDTKAKALRKMLLMERHFGHWRRKHIRANVAMFIYRRAHRHRLVRIFKTWRLFTKECLIAKLKVARFGQSRMLRVHLIRRHRAASKIQKWFRDDLMIKRVVIKYHHEERMGAFTMNAAEKMNSLRVYYAKWGRWWWNRKLWRATFRNRRYERTRKVYNAMKIFLRGEISQRNHLKSKYRISHGAFLLEVRRAYTVRRRRVMGAKLLIIQCAARCWFARWEKQKCVEWRVQLEELVKGALGRILAANWSFVGLCFMEWNQIRKRTKRIKSFQQHLLFKHARASIDGVFRAWKTLHFILMEDKLKATLRIQRFVRGRQAKLFYEALHLAKRFDTGSAQRTKEMAREAAERAAQKPPSRQRYRLPTGQLYSPFLQKLTDTLEDVKACEEPFFDTDILSAGQNYMQRFVMSKQRQYLIEKLETHISEERLRLRKRRRRSSTMWESRLKEASTGW